MAVFTARREHTWLIATEEAVAMLLTQDLTNRATIHVAH
jgi:hypothetical protein